MNPCNWYLAQTAGWLYQQGLGDWSTQLRLHKSSSGRIEPLLETLRTLAVDPAPLSIHQQAITCGSFAAAGETARDYLQRLKPWRKGPFVLHGCRIDGEWNCALKWQRMAPAIASRLAAGARVLDIGGGNGYYAWRCLLEGAALSLIVDPNPMAWAQWLSCHRLLKDQRCGFIPQPIEAFCHQQCQSWDLILCLGVLYHSPAPFALLRQIRNLLSNQGRLVLETLVIDGDAQQILTPQSTYASMPNVWAIPSLAALRRWLARCRFSECTVISPPVVTTTAEQSVTEWTNNFGLIDSLSEDKTRTVEGYPAPQRAIVMASR